MDPGRCRASGCRQAVRDVYKRQVLTLIYGLLKGFAADDLIVCVVGAAIMGGMVIWLHRANIQRIREGKELSLIHI